MAQAHVNIKRSRSSEPTEDIVNSKRKVSFCVDGLHYITVYQNETAQTVVTFRRGTRSITVPKELIVQMCDMKDNLQRAFDFVDIKI